MNDLEQISINSQIVAAPDETGSREQTVSIRVAPQSYLTALLLSTFFSAFLFYLEIVVDEEKNIF